MAFEMLARIDDQWKNLTIANDFVFCKTMLDPELCREVLEAILDIPIDRVEYIGRQEVLDSSPSAKAVRLDVYVRDEKGTVFNVEMQTVNKRGLPRRARFYQAMMAVDQLGRGESYDGLKDAYVIFVCGFDPFKRGRRVYWFENACREDAQLVLGDGAHTVFLAANMPRRSGDGGRLDEFLDYVAHGTVSGELSERLEEAVARVLDNEKWRLEFMMLQVRDQMNIDLGYAKGREEGLQEGREEGRQTGLAEGRQEGREVGLREGREEGEQRLGRLVAMLLEQGRTEDAVRAATDVAHREALYCELGLA